MIEIADKFAKTINAFRMLSALAILFLQDSRKLRAFTSNSRFV